MNEETITKAYEMAVERYAALGVDVPSVLAQMQDFHLSLHCWQADDVAGFEVQAGELSGGIQATGNYPGKATTPEELMADLDKAFSLVPGKKKLNLHASYAIFEDGEFADRDKLEPKHFKKWVEFAKERNLFVCCHLYEDRFSNGRYELAALKGWETKPNRLYGKDGLQEVKYAID